MEHVKQHSLHRIEDFHLMPMVPETPYCSCNQTQGIRLNDGSFNLAAPSFLIHVSSSAQRRWASLLHFQASGPHLSSCGVERSSGTLSYTKVLASGGVLPACCGLALVWCRYRLSLLYLPRMELRPERTAAWVDPSAEGYGGEIWREEIECCSAAVNHKRDGARMLQS